MDQLEKEIAKCERELWFKGCLRYLTRIGPQRDTYDFLMGRDTSVSAFGPFVLNFHRRLGKTFLIILLCIQTCLRRPHAYAKLAGPSLTHIGDILEEHWPIFMEACPPELEPDPWKNERFRWRNPRWGEVKKYRYSDLKLYGVNKDRGAKMRGGSTDTCGLDECREMADLMYTWKSVLVPTFKDRFEPLAIMISTPPDSMDHPWASHFLKEAINNGRYKRVSGAEDPTWSKEDDDMFAREMGGRHTPEYRREIGCELISDSSRLIIPEFVRVDHDRDGKLRNPYIVEDYPRPQAYFAYTMGDMGGAGRVKEDHTGILFSYVDFVAGKLIVEDELFLRDFDTKSLAEKWKEKAQHLYDPEIEKEMNRTVAGLKWFADANAQQLIDLYRLYHLNAHQVESSDREVARRLLRSAFTLNRIVISPRCKNLIYQLRNGTRMPNGDFARSKLLGHCDLISALIGLYRSIDLDLNPNPQPVYRSGNYWVAPKAAPRGIGGWSSYFARR